MDIKTFNEVANFPYVIIFENGKGTKLHRTSCSFVTKEDFNLKMIADQGNNGYYRPIEYYEDIRDATIVPCEKCKPTQEK